MLAFAFVGWLRLPPSRLGNIQASLPIALDLASVDIALSLASVDYRLPLSRLTSVEYRQLIWLNDENE